MKNAEQSQTGTLYVVATPIGNLEDITYRAVRILQEVDVIAAEDTRHTRQLLNHLGVHTPLISYYREKEAEKAGELIERMRAGLSIALVSDAGTPGISDPGAILINAAREAGITISPIPGPSALTAAVSAAGLKDGAFLFLGFAPARAGQRRKFLAAVSGLQFPLVFYESPHRIRALMTDALAVLGDRQAFWGRELTKVYEELRRGALSDLLEMSREQRSRGESVLIVYPGQAEQAQGATVEDLLLWYRDHSELSMKDVCRRIASDLGFSRSQVYQQALRIWQETDDGEQISLPKPSPRSRFP